MQRRKQLQTICRSSIMKRYHFVQDWIKWLKNSGIDPEQRPESLPIWAWQSLIFIAKQ